MRNVSIRAVLPSIILLPFLLSISTSALVNNCCFVDQQCESDEEWVSGYYAFHNNECAAPLAQLSSDQPNNQPRQPSIPAQPYGDAPGMLRNPQPQPGANQGQRDINQQPRRQPQRSLSQETGEIEDIYESKRITKLEDGTPVVIVSLTSWAAYWRAVCSIYTDYRHEYPECG